MPPPRRAPMSVALGRMSPDTGPTWTWRSARARCLHWRCYMDMNEIDLEFMEQESEDRLTDRDASFLGLSSDADRPDADANALLLETLD